MFLVDNGKSSNADRWQDLPKPVILVVSALLRRAFDNSAPKFVQGGGVIKQYHLITAYCIIFITVYGNTREYRACTATALACPFAVTYRTISLDDGILYYFYYSIR